MVRTDKRHELEATDPSPASLAALPDDELMERVQYQTFRFFWEDSHSHCGLAPDGSPARSHHLNDLVATGGSGFGVMALIVAVERGWVAREQALDRMGRMLDSLLRATCYHGAYPHFMHGLTGATIPFTRKDDGGDIVETSFLCMGLLCARQYFQRRQRRRTGAARPHHLDLGGGRMELVHPRGPRAALLALESEQRLGDGSWDQGLERVPDHLRAGGRLAPLSHRAGRLSPRLCGRTRLFQWQTLLRHRPAARLRNQAGRCSSRTTPSVDSIRAVSGTATPTIGSRTFAMWKSIVLTASPTRMDTRAMAPPAGD